VAERGARRAVYAGAAIAAAFLVWLASSLLGARARPQAEGSVAEGAGAAHAASESPEAARPSTTHGSSGGRSAAAPQPESSDEVRARLSRQALEQRSHNDARHAELAARWASETRDEPWSTDQEHALRAAASADAIDHLVIELECRRTLCRLEISAADSNTAFALERAHGFTAQLGTDTGSAMIGGGPDRALEVFAAREGMGSPKGP